MPTPNGGSFFDVLTAAVADITQHGFDSAERVAQWNDAIRAAAVRSLVPEHMLQQTLNDTMRAIYRKQVDRGGLLKTNQGVSRFTLDRVAPRLRAELDRRIMASADLIKLNRTKAIGDTIQRFSGWATSIPPGGSDVVARSETKADIRKSLTSLSYRERLVSNDQGHKLVANLNDILATDGGAIAVIWNSHAGEAGYDARPSHAKRQGKVYLLRGSWAQEAGFVKVGDAGYYDEVTAFGLEVNCRCFGTYLYALRSLPADMLTEKGRAEMTRVRIAA